VDRDLLRATWEEAESYGDDVALDFYTRLFLAHPELRDLFPPDMRGQRAHLAAILNLVVRSADDLDAVTPRLQRLGRDHRGYGAIAVHYPVVAKTLLETLEHFLGDGWTDDVAKTWATAIGLVAETMIAAAAKADGAREPATWLATIYGTDQSDDGALVTFEVAVADYRAAASDIVPVSIPDRPGTHRQALLVGWTADGTLTVLEVPVTLDDTVTLDLARLQVGDQLCLGAPLDPLTEGGRDGR
jgi:hemoglobin-like flavoprotein